MTTFNDALRQGGLDPREVILVRHSGRGATGLTPHDLWTEGSDRFERYQSTQEAGKPIFVRSKYWAAFVAEPGNTTLFVGMYRATLDDRSKIDWIDPLSGKPPGVDKGREADLYRLEPLPELSHLRSRLRILWSGSERAWVQYAHKNDKPIEGDLEVPAPQSLEGKRVWKTQLAIERASGIGREAKRQNASRNGGRCLCDACGFSHGDAGMFDAHHMTPLLAGERTTSTDDLLILCPTCHRRAHRSANRLVPYSLAELQDWFESGRP